MLLKYSIIITIVLLKHDDMNNSLKLIKIKIYLHISIPVNTHILLLRINFHKQLVVIKSKFQILLVPN